MLATSKGNARLLQVAAWLDGQGERALDMTQWETCAIGRCAQVHVVEGLVWSSGGAPVVRGDTLVKNDKGQGLLAFFGFNMARTADVHTWMTMFGAHGYMGHEFMDGCCVPASEVARRVRAVVVSRVAAPVGLG